MSSAFVRALSPAVAATTAAVVALTPDINIAKTQQTARHAAIMGAASIVELIELLPSDFRTILADPLHSVGTLVTKLVNTRNTLARWNACKVAGTVPVHLKGKPPTVQLTSEFADSDAARTEKAKLLAVYKKAQQDELDLSIRLKTDEVAALEHGCSPQTLWTKLRATVAAHTPTVLAHNRLPVIQVEDDGTETVLGLEPSDAITAVCNNVMDDCVAFAMRARSITESQLAYKALKMKKKKQVADAARTAAGDVEMADGTAAATGGTASVQSLVDKAVSAAMKKIPKAGKARNRDGKKQTSSAGQGKGKAKGDLLAAAKVRRATGTSRTSSVAYPLSATLRSRDRPSPGRQTQVRPSALQKAPVSKLTGLRGQTPTESPIWRRRSGQWPRETRQGAGARPQEERERKGKAKGHAHIDTWRSASTAPLADERSFMRGGYSRSAPALASSVKNQALHRQRKKWTSSSSSEHVSQKNNSSTRFHRPGSFICEGDLWVSSPNTMPDYVLTLPLPKAIDFVLSRMSLEMISNLNYQQDIHVSPGVDLPKEIGYQLSIGAKYMFHEPSNSELIRNAWADFNRRLRWRLTFAFDNAGEEPYDPDYDVRPKSNKQAPALPHYIELGLIKGRVFASEAIRKIPDAETLRHPHRTLQPDVGLIRKFLLDNEYVITGTDKNLGTAVSQRSWIVEKSRDILADVNNYRQLEHDELIAILDSKCTEMTAIGVLAKKHIDYKEGTVSDFLRSKVTLRGESHHIPKFYGIPKIHKQPVKMRPIIPCHSAIQNPAAKYVSKKLKPLIKAAATVIHGTKDLAQKLSSLSVDKSRRWYIVTGDVVAFYPNIPLQHCLDIVFDQYMEYYWNIPNHDDYDNLMQQRIFKRALQVGNTRLVTQFEGVVYEQLAGLAMGVADSPDLANLYGYEFEKRADVLSHPNIFYYGRYIDDCLAIVYAESEDDATKLLSNLIRYDNCTITWDSSASHQPFLDMMLYKDADNTLQHMPYRKNGNHQERIPWISAHPYDVKRGTFYGEMSRLATLSSKLEHYLEAMRGLVSLYIRRGYPASEVHKWLYSNLSKRWNERLAVRTASEGSDVLVLKSQYNLAWNYFNAHQLGDVIFGYWREWLARADRGDFNTEFPAPETNDDRVSDWGTRPTETRWDLRNTDIFNSRVIVSRKRTRNFLDISNLWKRSVIENIEVQALNDIVSAAAKYMASAKRRSSPDLNTIVVGPRLKRTRRFGPEDTNNSSDNEVEHVARRYGASSAPGPWRNAASGTWGRGSRH
jgi:hypothetical protein